MPPITVVATKAPSAMNTPWPKFSTSIRPKIKRQARGDDEDDHAHRQARDGERDPGRWRLPMAGNASDQHRRSAAAGGFQSKLELGASAAAGGEVAAAVDAQRCSLMRSERKAEQALLQASSSAASSCHRCRCARHGRRPSPPRGRPARVRHHEVLFDQQDRGILALQLAKGRRSGSADDRRRQALARLVDQQQFARLDRWRAPRPASASARPRACPRG